MGGKSFVVDEDGNEEELSDRNRTLPKQDSQLTLLSTESGFNEDNESENYQGANLVNYLQSTSMEWDRSVAASHLLW